ncbi:MAG TPA: NUDIX domain-containing protein [Verrucomicrobiae bacterium]|nr:NUDIX domain-containing protein [Verrucomicrobiae bacterium]
MPASKISLDKAKSDKLFYVVANVVVYRPSDGRCLLLKRSEQETAHPGKYGVIGGKLEWADLDITKPTRLNGDVLDYEGAIEKLLEREVMEEAGVTISAGLTYLNSVAYIRPDGIPSILIKFAATYAGGEVSLEEGAFTDFAWANAEEAKGLPCIAGIADEVATAIAHFQ